LPLPRNVDANIGGGRGLESLLLHHYPVYAEREFRRRKRAGAVRSGNTLQPGVEIPDSHFRTGHHRAGGIGYVADNGCTERLGGGCGREQQEDRHNREDRFEFHVVPERPKFAPPWRRPRHYMREVTNGWAALVVWPPRSRLSPVGTRRRLNGGDMGLFEEVDYIADSISGIDNAQADALEGSERGVEDGNGSGDDAQNTRPPGRRLRLSLFRPACGCIRPCDYQAAAGPGIDVGVNEKPVDMFGQTNSLAKLVIEAEPLHRVGGNHTHAQDRGNVPGVIECGWEAQHVHLGTDSDAAGPHLIHTEEHRGLQPLAGGNRVNQYLKL